MRKLDVRSNLCFSDCKQKENTGALSQIGKFEKNTPYTCIEMWKWKTLTTYKCSTRFDTSNVIKARLSNYAEN